MSIVEMKPRSPEQLKSLLLKWGRPLTSFKKGDRIKGAEVSGMKYPHTNPQASPPPVIDMRGYRTG